MALSSPSVLNMSSLMLLSLVSLITFKTVEEKIKSKQSSFTSKSDFYQNNAYIIFYNWHLWYECQKATHFLKPAHIGAMSHINLCLVSKVFFLAFLAKNCSFLWDKVDYKNRAILQKQGKDDFWQLVPVWQNLIMIWI